MKFPHSVSRKRVSPFCLRKPHSLYRKPIRELKGQSKARHLQRNGCKLRAASQAAWSVGHEMSFCERQRDTDSAAAASYWPYHVKCHRLPIVSLMRLRMLSRLSTNPIYFRKTMSVVYVSCVLRGLRARNGDTRKPFLQPLNNRAYASTGIKMDKLHSARNFPTLTRWSRCDALCWTQRLQET